MGWFSTSGMFAANERVDHRRLRRLHVGSPGIGLFPDMMSLPSLTHVIFDGTGPGGNHGGAVAVSPGAS